MATYVITGTYSLEGMKGVLRDGGEGRRKAIEAGFASAGGRLLALYFALGGNGVHVIAELPDAAALAAVGAVTPASGSFTSVEAVAVHTPEEFDGALQRTQGLNYRPPGR